MAINLFSFNTTSGVKPGIRPVPPHFDPMKRRNRTAYIPCGNSYVQIDKEWEPAYRDGMLFTGSVRTLSIEDGRSFEVLSHPNPQLPHLYLWVNLEPENETRPVKAVAHVEFLGRARAVVHDTRSGNAFIEFQEDGAIAFVWSPDGSIFRFVREDDRIEEWEIAPVMTAWQRTEQLREQIKGLDPLNSEHIPRHHGIIASAIRMLRHSRNREVQDIFVLFLLDQCEMLTDRMRKEIHEILLTYEHPEASRFAGESSQNGDECRCGDRRKPNGRPSMYSQRERLARPQSHGPSGKGHHQPPKKKA